MSGGGERVMMGLESPFEGVGDGGGESAEFQDLFLVAGDEESAGEMGFQIVKGFFEEIKKLPFSSGHRRILKEVMREDFIYRKL